MFLHAWQPTPIIFHLGSFAVHWYGVLLALGAVVGLLVMIKLAKQYSIAPARIYDLFFFCLLFGFIGARLYHVSNEWAFYSAQPMEIFKVWNGGLAIHGGMIAGLIVLWIYSRVTKINTWLLADLSAVGLVIGQAIGRWGNYFNQELFGRPTDRPWGVLIDPANRPTGYENFQYFHPTFLYESLGCLLIALILIWWYRQSKKRGRSAWWLMEGAVAGGYLILYSLLRIADESLRIDRVPIIAGVRLPIWFSAATILVVISLWFIIYRHRHAATDKKN